MSKTQMKLLTARQVADRLGLCTRSVYNLSREKIIPSIRLGKTLRFDQEDIESAIKRHRIA